MSSHSSYCVLIRYLGLTNSNVNHHKQQGRGFLLTAGTAAVLAGLCPSSVPLKGCNVFLVTVIAPPDVHLFSGHTKSETVASHGRPAEHQLNVLLPQLKQLWSFSLMSWLSCCTRCHGPHVSAASKKKLLVAFDEVTFM